MERHSPAGEAAEPATRRTAWVSANVGYLAGALGYGLDLTLGHTKARTAFGRPLAALDTVQQQLAQVATAADGLRLLSLGRPDDAALAHAAVAAPEGLAADGPVPAAVALEQHPGPPGLLRARRSGRVSRPAHNTPGAEAELVEPAVRTARAHRARVVV